MATATFLQNISRVFEVDNLMYLFSYNTIKDDIKEG